MKGKGGRITFLHTHLHVLTWHEKRTPNLSSHTSSYNGQSGPSPSTSSPGSRSGTCAVRNEEYAISIRTLKATHNRLPPLTSFSTHVYYLYLCWSTVIVSLPKDCLTHSVLSAQPPSAFHTPGKRLTLVGNSVHTTFSTLSHPSHSL